MTQPTNPDHGATTETALNRWDSINALSDCSNAHILEIAERVIEDVGGLLIKNRDILLSFLAEQQIDGAMLMQYQKRVFSKEVIAFADGNKKVNGPSGKFLKGLLSFDLTQMNGNGATPQNVDQTEEGNQAMPSKVNFDIPMCP